MLTEELITEIQSNKKEAKKLVFDFYFGKLAAIASRYSKDQDQAHKMVHHSFQACIQKLQLMRIEKLEDLDTWLETEFIAQCILFVKAISSEYYVSSTVHPNSHTSNTPYNLFESNLIIDFKTINTDSIISGLQKMVPAQRLVFNLHVIDGFSLIEIATKLETSEETVKNNLEKARYNFQKNIEKQLKSNLVS